MKVKKPALGEHPWGIEQSESLDNAVPDTEFVSFFDEEQGSKVRSMGSSETESKLGETDDSATDNLDFDSSADWSVGTNADSEEESLLSSTEFLKRLVAWGILLVSLLSLGIPYFGYICGRNRGKVIDFVFICLIVGIGAALVFLSFKLFKNIKGYIDRKNYF